MNETGFRWFKVAFSLSILSNLLFGSLELVFRDHNLGDKILIGGLVIICVIVFITMWQLYKPFHFIFRHLQAAIVLYLTRRQQDTLNE